MKVFQTIYTSAVTTLENRQGLGRVFCSRDLPDPLRERISHYEYDSDAGGAPIYSFERFPLSGEVWLLLNKAVPAVDYTGRTSCVSHTLAFREADLRSTGPIPTVFEFVRNFKWTTTWDGDPRWETEDKILTLQEVCKSVRTTGQMEYHDRSPAPLLVFRCEENGIPEPKRAAWKLAGQTPDDILDLFNRVWFAVDPWRGSRKYENYLGEPDMGPISSWHCTFATNLRNNSPNPYEWVVLSPKVPQMPSRETLDPATWEALVGEEIQAKIAASGIPYLLVERIQEGPENWARRKLKEKLDALKEDYQRKVRERNSELTNEARSLLEELEAKVSESNKLFIEAGAKGLYVFSKEDTGFLNNLKARLDTTKNKARDSSKDLFEEYRIKKDPIMTLSGSPTIDDENREDDSIFADEAKKITELGAEWEQIAPFADFYMRTKELENDYTAKIAECQALAADKNKAEGERDEKNTEIGKLTTGVKNLNDELRKLPNKQKTKMPVSKNQWFWASCGLLGVIFALTGIYVVKNPSLNNKDIAALQTEVKNLKNQNKNLLAMLPPPPTSPTDQKRENQKIFSPQRLKGDDKSDLKNSPASGVDPVKPNPAAKDKPSSTPATQARERAPKNSDKNSKPNELEEKEIKGQKDDEADDNASKGPPPGSVDQIGSSSKDESFATHGSGTVSDNPPSDNKPESANHPAPTVPKPNTIPPKPGPNEDATPKPSNTDPKRK